ncbi:uncharacterized protein BO80DRAFT_126328 [Aspergillus ibericus CBS 121593]|uniref:Uncharacterized protein n=1 Tax=Aspergillus ibericus CBS 121593 TaxID=1448316 RepID=A0A395GZR8_9EURO|nr:hypothetical protein BO80DRAFT_126328 [Aspergillus ibericus CBS 121593]RAK99533.1 hypothetical protein BO80DRAFT_126328 [Aspergillus ibericus CBS 121593]
MRSNLIFIGHTLCFQPLTHSCTMVSPGLYTLHEPISGIPCTPHIGIPSIRLLSSHPIGSCQQFTTLVTRCDLHPTILET